MMTRRSLRRRIAAATTALFAIAAVATTGAAPVGFTEASWTDDVYVNAPFEADEYAGVNTAQAAAAYTLLDRIITDGDTPGISVRVNNENGNTRSSLVRDAEDPFRSAGILNALSYEAHGRACARAGDQHCLANPPPEVQHAPIGAYSHFDYFLLKSTQYFGVEMIKYDSSLPISVQATCAPGSDGITTVSSGGPIKILTGGSNSAFEELNVPLTPGVSQPVTVNRAFQYTGTISHIAESKTNHATAEVKLNVKATTLPVLGVSLPLWELDILLASAECRNSAELPEFIDGESASNLGQRISSQSNPEHTDRTEGLADPDASKLTSTTPSISENDSANSIDGPDTTTSRDSSTSTTAPSSSRPTVTVTSESLSTSTRPTTSSTRSAPKANSTRITSVRATPPSASPAKSTATSTSATPSVVIPDEPADLSATAWTAGAWTVEVHGEDLDVVARGANVPVEARAGARVLGNWINDDSTRTGDWKPFASTDPESDGWRWAAINQTTGTVVYIR